MKTGKKLLLTALSATLATSLTTGLALTAFADEATQDHVYNAKFDKVFEDFDRADISDTVTVSSETSVNWGETPHLHVVLDGSAAEGEVGNVYKHGSGSLANVAKSGGTVTVRMRSETELSLSDLYFGVRGDGFDSDAKVVSKSFAELTGKSVKIAKTWTDYTVNFARAYESTDAYPDDNGDPTDSAVTETNMTAVHLFTKTGVEGVLDIDSITYNAGGDDAVLNNFTGGLTVVDTGSASDSGMWWNGSVGTVVRRSVNVKEGGSFTVVKNFAVGDFAYAIIEAEGDLDNLKVATTTDGTNWGAAEAFDKVGLSVRLNGTEKGFKFTYEGSDENGVTVKRVYLTNNVIPEPTVAVPVIDAKTAEVLDDFSVAQSGFTGADDMQGRPETDLAGLEYRKSWHNGNMVEVKDGSLVFDATNLAADDYIDFRFYSKSSFEGKYLVLKVAAKDGANLNDFRFQLADEGDSLKPNTPVYANDLKAGIDFKAALLTEKNPYKEGDWYYVVLDIDESGLASDSGKYGGLNMYYSGTGKLYIDCIFVCDGLEVTIPDEDKYIVREVACNTHLVDVENLTNGYTHSWLEVDNSKGNGVSVEFDITAKTEDFDISSLRLEFGENGVFWAAENAEGTLKTKDGKMLSELTYTKDVPTHVVIDFAKTGITEAFGEIDVHMGAMKGFKISNITLKTSTPFYSAQDIDKTKFDEANAYTVAEEKTFEASGEGYAYAFGYENIDEKVYDKLEFTLVPGAGFTGADLRFEFSGGGTTYWFTQHDDVVTADGKKFNELTFTAGTPVQFSILLSDIGVDYALSAIHVHTTGTATGSFTTKDLKLVNYASKDFITPVVEKHYTAKWAEQLALLPAYLDKVAPEVSISTATTAEAGDEIEITYVASDNLTAAADLDVTVAVTKDGNAVTLNGNKFTAEEGVYTVTVTVRDANGNEASDTIQITVSADGNGTVVPPTDTGCAGGCGSTSIEGGFIAGGMALMGICVLFAVNKVIRRKKNNA